MGDWNISWHHETLGIPDLWTRGVTGEGATVALLDTGLSSPPGLDRPDFEYLDSGGKPTGAGDPHGHGTCCASLIASYAGGVLGIAPFARVVSLRVLETGTTIADVEAALQFVLARGGIDVVSCSFILDEVTPAIAETIRALTNAGSLVVAAAGDDDSVKGEFPERTPNALTVAAVDGAAAPLPGARLGAWIDVAAPGFELPVVTARGVAGLFSESSAAAAVVSGVAALLLSAIPSGRPRRKAAQALEGVFKTTAAPISAADPGAVGRGLIRPAAALEAIRALSSQEDT